MSFGRFQLRTHALKAGGGTGERGKGIMGESLLALSARVIMSFVMGGCMKRGHEGGGGGKRIGRKDKKRTCTLVGEATRQRLIIVASSSFGNGMRHATPNSSARSSLQRSLGATTAQTFRVKLWLFASLLFLRVFLRPLLLWLTERSHFSPPLPFNQTISYPLLLLLLHPRSLASIPGHQQQLRFLSKHCLAQRSGENTKRT